MGINRTLEIFTCVIQCFKLFYLSYPAWVLFLMCDSLDKDMKQHNFLVNSGESEFRQDKIPTDLFCDTGATDRNFA